RCGDWCCASACGCAKPSASATASECPRLAAALGAAAKLRRECPMSQTANGARHEDDRRLIFSPLRFRSLTVGNRLFRSSISGTFDNYDGSGTPARVNWEEKFARGGVGAIISSFTPVHVRGRILTRYAMVDHDDKIPFWKAVGERVHAYKCVSD